ncbi:MAG: hypothetical protein ACO23N_04690 [Opitutales bacterium]|jgi:hypothetical protein
MDIRKPIGLLFLILGAILMAWGAFGGEAAAGKLPFNLNLWWGVVLVVFGGAMHFFAARAAKAESASCGTGCGCAKSK